MVALGVAQDFKKVAALSSPAFVKRLDVIPSQVSKTLNLLLFKLQRKLNFIFSGDWFQQK